MLTARKTATVLAALRHWQTELLRHGASLTQHNLHFEQVPPLTPAEIDGLCEWLNLAETCYDEPADLPDATSTLPGDIFL
jgi:hypothetical protein